MAEEEHMIRAKGRNEYEREKKTGFWGCDASNIGNGVRVGNWFWKVQTKCGSTPTCLFLLYSAFRIVLRNNLE